MPKRQSEEDKKHGDKLESLIGRTGGSKPDQDASGDDPTELQDDDDEDVQNDDADSSRDVGDSH
jgi:hypothetical protein